MPRTPLIVVGTQIDLREDENIKLKLAKRRQRPSTPEDGERFAKKIGAYAYVECSALTRQGLKDVFDEALLAVLDPRDVKPEKKGGRRFRCTIL
jgi:cell division control protein 42